MSLGRTNTMCRLFDIAAVSDRFGHQETNISVGIVGNKNESVKRELNLRTAFFNFYNIHNFSRFG